MDHEREWIEGFEVLGDLDCTLPDNMKGGVSGNSE